MTGGVALILRLEGHPAEWNRLLQVFDADPARVHIAANLPRGSAALEVVRAIVEQVNPDITIVDTYPSFAALVGLIKSATGDSNGWTELGNWWGELAAETGTAVVFLHHSKKTGDEYRDSTAIGASVDQILTMKRCEADENVRTIEPVGRWHVPSFAIRLDAGRYSMADRSAVPIGLEERILAFVAEHVGCSQRAVRDGVDGRSQDVDATTRRLLASGQLRNRGRSGRYELEVGSSDSGSRQNALGRGPDASGTTPGTSDSDGVADPSTSEKGKNGLGRGPDAVGTTPGTGPAPGAPPTGVYHPDALRPGTSGNHSPPSGSAPGIGALEDDSWAGLLEEGA